jgi:hypothetical protein
LPLHNQGTKGWNGALKGPTLLMFTAIGPLFSFLFSSRLTYGAF